MNQQSVFGEVIYGYSRAQAIDDGVLVDVSDMAREAGFVSPVAVTAAAWGDCVAWSDVDTKQQCHQDEAGRLWDVLWMAKQAARRAQGDRLAFQIYRVPCGGRGAAPRLVTLLLTIGAGDEREAVITVMMPDED
jgi:hypothetical protein